MNATSVYVVGDVNGALPGESWAGESDAFLRRYDFQGKDIWTREFGSSASDSAQAVAVNSTGIYVVGATADSLNSINSWVRKYGFDGSLLWLREVNNASVTSVAADESGGYVAGTLTTGVPFLNKYENDGSLSWNQTFNPGIPAFGNGVALDATGVYLVGDIRYLSDAFVRKYDLSSELLWARQLASEDLHTANAVAIASSSIYVVGQSLLSSQPPLSFDAYIRKYDPDGNTIWTRHFGTSGVDTPRGVATDSTGVYVSGLFAVDSGPLCTGDSDLAVRKYDADGNVRWSCQFGLSGVDYANGVAAISGTVYSVGGINAGTTTDAFLAKLSTVSPKPVVNDGGIVNNASYVASPAPVAPGSIAAIFGSDLDDGSIITSSSYGPDGKLVTLLAGASVTINDIPAPMFYSTPGQLGV